MKLTLLIMKSTRLIMRLRILFLLVLLFSFKAGLLSQNITNEGTDFWFAYPEMHDKANAVYEAHITSRTNASGTVIIPGASPINFTVI